MKNMHQKFSFECLYFWTRMVTCRRMCQRGKRVSYNRNSAPSLAVAALWSAAGQSHFHKGNNTSHALWLLCCCMQDYFLYLVSAAWSVYSCLSYRQPCCIRRAALQSRKKPLLVPTSNLSLCGFISFHLKSIFKWKSSPPHFMQEKWWRFGCFGQI